MHHDVTTEAMHMVLGLLRLLRPHRVLGATKIRLGRFFDGGYVMLDGFEGVTAAYSLGVNDDVSWDLDIVHRGIPVFQFDHTIDALPLAHELFTWQKTGISASANSGEHFTTLPRALAGHGHDGSDNLLLKCDIEGHEWEVFAELPGSVLRRFSQIVIEVHNLDQLSNMRFANLVLSATRNLLVHHRVVHVHGNNFAGFAVVGGVPVPASLELSFARLDRGEFVPSDEVFPTPLDMPCHSKDADLYLGRFTFD